MGVLEQISNISMVVFVLFSILLLFVYLYRLFVKVETYYSQGINLYISLDNLRNMVIYGFLGSIFATFLQKIDKKRKWIQASIITGVGLAFLILLIVLGNVVTENIKLNMLIIVPVFLALGIGFYFLNDFLAKKKYSNKILSENE